MEEIHESYVVTRLVLPDPRQSLSYTTPLSLYVSIRFLSSLKYFFQFSMMFILFKSGTRRSFISFVLMYFL